MNRRQLVLASAVLAVAPLLRAQEQRIRRIGILVPSAFSAALVAPFSKQLAALGWVEGRNLLIELRNAEARQERLPALAAELVRLKVDLLVTVSTPATRAVKNAAGTIPVVFAWVGDPVASKFVASLARPGGTVTGLSIIAAEVAPKQFELLRALVPGLTRVAQLHDPKYAADPLNAAYIELAARTGIELIPVIASTPAELESAFAAAVRERAGAMLIPPRPLNADQNARIVQLAKQFRMPCAAQSRNFPVAGGLLSYGVDFTDAFMRMAPYVDKILRGAKPADLPVEQADRIETVINRKTARELGLTIPQSVLLRADQVIE